MKRALLLAVALVGCASRLLIAPPAALPVEHVAVHPHVAPPPAPAVTVRAKHAIAAAAHYVAQPSATAESIERLTRLTHRIDEAILTMKAHEWRGRYRSSDVMAVRKAASAVTEWLKAHQ